LNECECGCLAASYKVDFLLTDPAGCTRKILKGCCKDFPCFEEENQVKLDPVIGNIKINNACCGTYYLSAEICIRITDIEDVMISSVRTNKNTLTVIARCPNSVKSTHIDIPPAIVSLPTPQEEGL
jgi:hypothetical protein